MGYSPGVGPNTKKLQAVTSLRNASGTVWAAISGSRWTLDNIFVSYSGATEGQEVLIMDDSVTMARIPVEATQMTDSFYVGYSSSVTNTSLRMQAPADGTVNAVFVGHSGGE